MLTPRANAGPALLTAIVYWYTPTPAVAVALPVFCTRMSALAQISVKCVDSLLVVTPSLDRDDTMAVLATLVCAGTLAPTENG